MVRGRVRQPERRVRAPIAEEPTQDAGGAGDVGISIGREATHIRLETRGADIGGDDDAIHRMTELFARHGDIYRFHSPARRAEMWVINHPDDVKRVLVSNHKNYTKGSGLDRVKILLNRITTLIVVTLAVAAVWMLAVHWLDLYWLVMPTHYTAGPRLHWLGAVAGDSVLLIQHVVMIPAMVGVMLARFEHYAH